jgi:tetratricopeptide (TPR) repeat protein
MVSPRLSGLLMLLVAFGAGMCLPGFGAQPLTDAECEEFGRQLESHLVHGDSAFYANAFDLDKLLRRILPDEDQTNNWQEKLSDFQKHFRDEIIKGVSQAEQSKFLRVRRDGGEPRVLMRFAGESYGVNYHELNVERGTGGKLSITDAFIFSTGEKISDLMKRTMLPFVAEANKSLLQRLFGDKPDLVRYGTQYGQMFELQKEGKHKEALDIYAQLPPSLQHEKFILVIRLKTEPTDPDYIAALDLWRSLYPRDPSIDLVSMDAFVSRKQYSEALACLDRLDKSVGGDPYLNLQRAMIFTLMEEPDKANEAAGQAFEQEPTLVAAGFIKFDFLAKEKKYDECILLLDLMVAKSGCSKGILARAIEKKQKNADFIHSEQYHKWRNPSSQPLPAAPATATKSTGPPKVKLQSIIYAGDRSSATIGGKFVMVGDQIEDCKVVAIEKQSVTLESPDGEKKVLMVGASLK